MAVEGGGGGGGGGGSGPDGLAQLIEAGKRKMLQVEVVLRRQYKVIARGLAESGASLKLPERIRLDPSVKLPIIEARARARLATRARERDGKELGPSANLQAGRVRFDSIRFDSIRFAGLGSPSSRACPSPRTLLPAFVLPSP